MKRDLGSGAGASLDRQAILSRTRALSSRVKWRKATTPLPFAMTSSGLVRTTA